MKDQTAREEIAALRSELAKLREETNTALQYQEKALEPLQSPWTYLWDDRYTRKTLTAAEILNRFEELYDFLGIERITHKEKTTVSLEKKKK